jgi:hypothetical protein
LRRRSATVSIVGLPEHDIGQDRYPALARVIRLLGEGEFQIGLDELGTLIMSGDPDLQPRAVLLLGRLNEARGNMEEMLNAYRWAADSGHPEIAAFASFELGLKLLDLGQVGPARRALKRAARAGDSPTRELARTALKLVPRRWWQR